MPKKERPRLRRHPIEVRALPDEGEGTVEAIVSVYGIPYKVGWGVKEQIEPGCFDESIRDHPIIPLFWMHGWNQGLLIGDATATSTKTDLRAQGQLWIDDPLGLRVWRGLMSKALREWSIGFFAETIQTDVGDDDEDDLERIVKGELIEASSVVRGANPDTDTVSVAALRSLFGIPDDAGDEVDTLVRAIRERLPELRNKPSVEERIDKLLDHIERNVDEPAPELDIPPERLKLLSRPAVRALLRDELAR